MRLLPVISTGELMKADFIGVNRLQMADKLTSLFGKEIAEEYKVHILGTRNDEMLKFSFVICDKNSKGNAFEIARDLWEKNHIGAEPALGGELL